MSPSEIAAVINDESLSPTGAAIRVELMAFGILREGAPVSRYRPASGAPTLYLDSLGLSAAAREIRDTYGRASPHLKPIQHIARERFNNRSHQ